jgi:hypothetical protein
VNALIAAWILCAAPLTPAEDRACVALDARVAADWPVWCHEDAPCWDCHAMGNRVCGPTAPDR